MEMLQELRGAQGRHASSRHPSVVAWVFFEGNDLNDDHKLPGLMKVRLRGAEVLSFIRPGFDAPLKYGFEGFVFVTNVLAGWLRRWSHLVVPEPHDVLGAASQVPPGMHALIHILRHAEVSWTDSQEARCKIARAARKERAFAPRARSSTWHLL